MKRFFKTIDSDMGIDAVLYCAIALFGFCQTYFTSEDAYKYVSPYALFWLKGIIGACGAVAAALKMFRSTTFSDHKRTRTGNTEFLSNPNPPQPPKDT